MIDSYKNVHDMLVSAYAKFYDGHKVDFKKVCDNVKQELENKELIGQNPGVYPDAYYSSFEDSKDFDIDPLDQEEELNNEP